MDAVHAEIIRNQQIMSWVLTIVASELFASLILVGVCIYLARGTRASVERVAAMADRVERSQQRMEEESRRLGFYLFSKLGPADTR